MLFRIGKLTIQNTTTYPDPGVPPVGTVADGRSRTLFCVTVPGIVVRPRCEGSQAWHINESTTTRQGTAV